MNKLTDLPNLGPASARMLKEVDIHTADDLKQIGAAVAFSRVKFQFGRHATLHLLWALEGALTQRDWRTLDEKTKSRLRLETGL